MVRMNASQRSLRARARAALLALPRARELLAVRRDARMFAREHPGLASDLAAAGPGAQHLLLVSLSDDIEQARLEAILAKALQVHGARVTILTWRWALRARLFFRALRLRHLAYYDDFVA